MTSSAINSSRPFHATAARGVAVCIFVNNKQCGEGEVIQFTDLHHPDADHFQNLTVSSSSKVASSVKSFMLMMR